MIEGLRGSAAAVAGWGILPSFLMKTALLAKESPTIGESRRILVIVQLSGGNDGLNTVIPFADDQYYKARPTLAVPRSQVLGLNQDVGLSPELAPFKELYDEGALSVIQNVGYKNPNRSHFASMDIWHTASMDPVRANTTGWIGRLLDRSWTSSPSNDPLVLHFDNEPLPLALSAMHQVVPSMGDLSSFRVSSEHFNLMQNILSQMKAKEKKNAQDLDYIRKISAQAATQAETLDSILKKSKSTVEYPGSELGKHLQQMAALIGGGFKTRIYYTSVSGFDTHSNQAGLHSSLLRNLGQAIGAFQRDLAARGCEKEVILMTLSEFGRRIEENNSRGTDHGTAAPLFIAGAPVKPGVLGGKPDLEKTREGDLIHRIDFRQVYASVLESWLEVPSKGLLGGEYAKLPILA